jgi:hypothetical protein
MLTPLLPYTCSQSGSFDREPHTRLGFRLFISMYVTVTNMNTETYDFWNEAAVAYFEEQF